MSELTLEEYEKLVEVEVIDNNRAKRLKALNRTFYERNNIEIGDVILLKLIKKIKKKKMKDKKS